MSRALIGNETAPVQAPVRNGGFAGLAQLDPLARTLWGWLAQYDPTSSAEPVRGLGIAGATVRRHRPQPRRAFDRWRSVLRPEHRAVDPDCARSRFLRDSVHTFRLLGCLPEAEAARTRSALFVARLLSVAVDRRC